MTPRSWTILNALVHAHHSGQEEKLLSLLPESDQEAAKKHDLGSADMALAIMRPLALTERMHYSWLAKLIESDPPDVQALFLASIPARIRDRLKRLLGFQGTVPTLPPSVEAFFRSRLYSRATAEQPYTPAALIPQQQGQALLNLDKEHLLNVIDFLGLYDLVPLMRGSIDQKFLNTLFRDLTEHKREYIQQLLRKKQKGMTDPKGLGRVKRKEQSFARWLHGKGLRRLAILLKNHDEQFLWHVYHVLDTGRAELLESLVDKIEVSETEQQDVEEKFKEVIEYLHYRG